MVCHPAPGLPDLGLGEAILFVLLRAQMAGTHQRHLFL